MSDRELMSKISEDVGYIRGKIEGIENRLENVEGTTSELVKKVSNILGYASGAGAVLGLAAAFIKDWMFKR